MGLDAGQIIKGVAVVAGLGAVAGGGGVALNAAFEDNLLGDEPGAGERLFIGGALVAAGALTFKIPNGPRFGVLPQLAGMTAIGFGGASIARQGRDALT